MCDYECLFCVHLGLCGFGCVAMTILWVCVGLGVWLSVLVCMHVDLCGFGCVAVSLCACRTVWVWGCGYDYFVCMWVWVCGYDYFVGLCGFGCVAMTILCACEFGCVAMTILWVCVDLGVWL